MLHVSKNKSFALSSYVVSGDRLVGYHQLEGQPREGNKWAGTEVVNNLLTWQRTPERQDFPIKT